MLWSFRSQGYSPGNAYLRQLRILLQARECGFQRTTRNSLHIRAEISRTCLVPFGMSLRGHRRCYLRCLSMPPISANVIAAFLRLSTRFDSNLRSSTPISRLPHPGTQRASPDHLSPPFTFPCRPVDPSTVLPPSGPTHAHSHPLLTVGRLVNPTRSLVPSKKLYALLALISQRCRSLPLSVLDYRPAP